MATRFLGTTIALVALLGGSADSVAAQYDVLIRNGRVLDGSGNPWRAADVAITGERVVAVGRLASARAARVIDATGLYVTPGFIDAHSHAGPALATQDLSNGRPLLTQGVTTVFVNPDGGGPTDLVEQREHLIEHGLGVNVALLVPHGSVRRSVMGMADRSPTNEELEHMSDLVRRGMDAGAYGLSSGLFYAPGSYSETAEVIELAKVAARYGGVYISHIRDEADYTIGVVAAVDEVIEIAREADITGVVTHIKALGPRVWGYGHALVHRIQRAREEGLRIYADQYPYEASGTGIAGALIPRWAQVGGNDALMERLRDREQRARIRADVIENLDRRGGAGRLQFRRHRADPSIEGRTLLDVAEQRGRHPADLALELMEAGGASLVSFNMIDTDIVALMQQPWTMTSSDGGLVPFGEGVPHPRYYGPFPRKVRLYVQERHVMTLPDAIRTMTSLPAQVFGMDDRGTIRSGAVADLVVFDLDAFRDLATYSDPHQYSEGVVHVLVNGQFAVADGRVTGTLAGQVLGKRPTS